MALVNCKDCGKEIGKDVKKCIHCGSDQRNFFGKHKIITAILILALLGGIGSALGGDEGSPASAPVTSSTSDPAPEPEPEQPKVVELSSEGVSSDVTIAVTGFESADSIGDNEFSIAKAQGVFKVVSVTITNNQKDAITIDSNSFKLFDDQDREFSYSSEAQMAMMTSVNDKQENFFLKKINPGMNISGKIAFDVPKDAKGFKLEASGGMMGKPIMLKVE